MSRYAQNTSVSVSKSKAEIEDTLNRYGCSGFASGYKDDLAFIAFEMSERQCKFILPMPPKSDYSKTEKGKNRTADATHKAWEQACRQRWRALALAIKAKLEAVECGIVTFDQEFLAHIVGPNGRTVGQTVIPAIEAGAKQLPQLGFQ